MSPWPHLLRTVRQRVNVRPASLRRLSICPANAWGEVEREQQVTRFDVCWEVELRNKVCNVAYTVPQFLLVREDVHSFTEILVPLAGNIVRNVQDKDFATAKLFPENKVDIEVPV